MIKDDNVLLLVGSPKASSSSSAALGNYLTSRLEEFGLSIEKEYIYKLIRKKEGQKKLLSKVNNADLIILAFPLYVDCLPAGVTKALELIANHRKSLNNPKKPGFVVLINCGFPEAEQNNTAVAICKIFAREVGFVWKGALALGMGSGLGERSLEELGGMVRNVTKGFDLAAQALAEGREIPEEAIELVAKRLMPTTLYTKMGNLGWKKQAKKFGAHKKLKAKPYL
ncbi:MAG: NAD(P)H-dependent oxidoreductase [Candidatus Heimdallarchaeota archaeon]|nr:NAD(P)H-dependent oxidoreductase [Candidatus Heimdallarchaeota archaeon]